MRVVAPQCCHLYGYRRTNAKHAINNTMRSATLATGLPAVLVVDGVFVTEGGEDVPELLTFEPVELLP